MKYLAVIESKGEDLIVFDNGIYYGYQAQRVALPPP